MRRLWAAALTIAVTLLVGSASIAASATDPVDLGAGHVVDDVGALTLAEQSRTEDRLAQLYADTGIDLYVALVDTFTDPADSQQWADTVARANGLGVAQYLLVIATDSRQYYISADTQGPLSKAQLGAIETDIRPQLSDGDWAGAITTAADAVEEDATGSDGFSAGTIVLVVLLALVVVAGAAWFVMRSRRRRAAADAESIALEELERRAASALVATDDAVRTSEQELAFATAQFGETATAPFEDELARARSTLSQAFALRQRLDDAEPDSDEQVRAWNADIVRLCAQANAGLDEKAAAFDELRALEANAPEAFARVQEQRAAVAAGLDDADSRLRALHAAYAPEALATVEDNPQQARARLAFADEQLSAAHAAIGAGDGGAAAVAIRASEEAVAQARLLDDAIEALAGDLVEGERAAALLIDDLDQDVAVAASLPDHDGTVAAAITAVRQQLETARANLSSTRKRPLVSVQALEAANARIDAVISNVRDAEATAQRERQLTAHVISQAHAQIAAAESYITARRGAVGAQARTRVAEAASSLALARDLTSSAPQRALTAAQRAHTLASEAISAAQSDVGGYPGGSGSGALSSPAGSGSGMLGAMLGGIVLDSLLSGGAGSRGARRGTSGFGGMLGGGSRGRGGARPARGIRTGSFGGGGTRGRRGGGRF